MSDVVTLVDLVDRIRSMALAGAKPVDRTRVLHCLIADVLESHCEASDGLELSVHELKRMTSSMGSVLEELELSLVKDRAAAKAKRSEAA